jgi:hypothetical protein
MPQDGYFTSHHPANIAFAPYEQMGGNGSLTTYDKTNFPHLVTLLKLPL